MRLADVVRAVDVGAVRRGSYEGDEALAQDRLVVFWEVGDVGRSEVIAYLERVTWPAAADGDADELADVAPRFTVTDPVVDRDTPWRGVWRRGRVYQDPNYPGRVFLELRRGLLESLVDGEDAVLWSEGVSNGVVATTGREAEALAAAGDGSVSVAPVLSFAVRWPGVAREAEHAGCNAVGSAASVEFGGAGVAGPAGVPDGTYRVARVESVLAADGTVQIEARLVSGVLRFDGYDAASTPRGMQRVYLLGVPEVSVQPLLDAWKAAAGVGAGGGVSRGADGLCTVQLTAPDVTVANLSVTVAAAQHHGVREHFAWGYTEAQLGTFLANHGGALAAGVTRDAPRVTLRSDGYYDAIVVERAIAGAQSSTLALSGNVDLLQGIDSSAVPSAPEGKVLTGGRVQPRVDGLADYALRAETPFTEASFTLERLEPAAGRWGYTDTVEPFYLLERANLPTLGVGEYGFFEQLRVDEHGRYTGRLRKRSYVGATFWAWWSTASPEFDELREVRTRRIRKWQEAPGGGEKRLYVIDVYVDVRLRCKKELDGASGMAEWMLEVPTEPVLDPFPAADEQYQLFEDGRVLRKIVFQGKEYWYGEKVVREWYASAPVLKSTIGAM